jgi:subtilase family serine protease
MRSHTRSVLVSLFALFALGLAACDAGSITTSGAATSTSSGAPGSAAVTATPNCTSAGDSHFGYSPEQMRAAYGVTSLIQKGYTGKGQTVVAIESFGSPTLQQDLDTFDQHYCLPKATVQIISPLGTKPFDPSNSDMAGWAGETTMDVELIHALAPDAGIVVLTSPVSETEGTIGLPQFRQIEQYALDHHLGNVISQSFGASEVTLQDSVGQAELAKWTTLYQQATTQQGVTFTASSGDSGATDYADIAATQLSSTPTTSFPTDEPWVLSTGGTKLQANGAASQEVAWPESGGGFSSFFSEPDFQKNLPGAVQSQLNNRRGVPDVAADSDPYTGMDFYCSDSICQSGGWTNAGGTSAAAPTWAALIAIADQMAGHGLGYINPALYKIEASSAGQADFRDITSGNNSFSGTGDKGGRPVDVPGYDAVPGWDPVTGLGSPIADKLLPDLVATVGK